MKKKLISILLITVMLMGCFTVVSFGVSKTKKMTAYSCIKDGNFVYCAAEGGIYKVDVTKKSATRLVKSMDDLFGEPPVSLSLYKGYIYYLDSATDNLNLYRISVNGGSKKKLASKVSKMYVISGSKIFFKTRSKSKTVVKQMKLNGKAKKKSGSKVKMTTEKTNTPGYTVFTRTDKEQKVIEDTGLMKKVDKTDCLKMPDGSLVELYKYTEYYDL